jgi:hypothetical protein
LSSPGEKSKTNLRSPKSFQLRQPTRKSLIRKVRKKSYQGCERFPNLIKLKDRRNFGQDYKVRENKQIKDYLEVLDRKFYELFFGNLYGS